MGLSRLNEACCVICDLRREDLPRESHVCLKKLLHILHMHDTSARL